MNVLLLLSLLTSCAEIPTTCDGYSSTAPTLRDIEPTSNSWTVKPTKPPRLHTEVFTDATEQMFTARLIKTKLDFVDVDYYLEQTPSLEYLSQFENVLQRETVRAQLRYCPYVALCGFSLELTIYAGFNWISCCDPCSCDYPSCMGTQTCCPDIIPARLFDIVTIHGESILPAELQTPSRCVLLHGKFKGVRGEMAMYMKTGCSVGTSSDLMAKCMAVYTPDSIDSISDMLPVDWTSNGVTNTYRNEYCARCQGVAEKDMDFWDALLTCSSNVTDYSFLTNDTRLVQYTFEYDRCSIDFGKGNLVVLSECASGNNICNTTGLWQKYDPVLERQCLLYTSTFMHVNMSNNFQNIFCLMCNGLEPKSTVCNYVDFGDGGESYSFSGLLSMSTSTSRIHSEEHGQRRCAPNHVHNQQTDSCIAVQCSPLHFMTSDGRCQRVFNTSASITYSLYIRLVPTAVLQLDAAYIQSSYVLNEVHAVLLEQLYTGVFGEVGTLRRDSQTRYASGASVCEEELYYAVSGRPVNGNTDINVTSAIVRLQVQVDDVHYPYRVRASIIAMDNQTLLVDATEYSMRIIDHFGFPFNNLANETTDNFKFPKDGYAYKEIGRETSVDSDTGMNQYIFVPYLDDDIGKSDTNVACPLSAVTIKALSVKDCAMVSLTIVDLGWVKTEDGFYNAISDQSIKHSDFLYENANTISVCLELSKELQTDTHTRADTNTLDTVLSIILVSISLTALLSTLIVYCMLPTLQTLPGKNIMSLSFHLVIAQSLYLISSFAGFRKLSYPCVAVGVALHWFWLTAILWMQVCTFHMLTVLTVTKVMSPRHGKRFAFYNLYTVTMATLLVGINVVVSLMKSHGASVGYGSRACYVSSSEMLQYTFGIPTAVVIVSNIIMFVYVIIKLSRLSMVKSSNHHDRNDIIIFMKLSSLTGVTWVFGFLYTWTGITVFSYLFIWLSSSMGVFILFSFVVNRRVAKLLQKRVGVSSIYTKSTTLTITK